MSWFSAIETTCGEMTCGETSVCAIATGVCFFSNRALKEGRTYRERKASVAKVEYFKATVLEVGYSRLA
jgi:hypothetical protein